MKRWLIILLIFVTGCATQHGYWYNKDRSPAQARQDALQCEGEAHEAVCYQHGFSLYGFKVRGGPDVKDERITVADEFARRMKARGYNFISTEDKPKEETK